MVLGVSWFLGIAVEKDVCESDKLEGVWVWHIIGNLGQLTSNYRWHSFHNICMANGVNSIGATESVLPHMDDGKKDQFDGGPLD